MNVVETETPLNGVAKMFVYKEGNSPSIIGVYLNFDGTYNTRIRIRSIEVLIGVDAIKICFAIRIA